MIANDRSRSGSIGRCRRVQGGLILCYAQALGVVDVGSLLVELSWRIRVRSDCYDFSSLYHPICLLRTVFSTPRSRPRFVSHVTFPFRCHTSLRHHLPTWLPPSSLSRTLTHYAYLLIILSPISHTILRPVVAGLSQAPFVFNHS